MAIYKNSKPFNISNLVLYATNEYVIQKAPNPLEKEISALSSYTYAYIMVYGALTGLNFEVCFNSRASIMIILEEFVLYFIYTIKVRKKPYKLKGIGSKPVRISKFTIFIFFILGLVNS